MLSIWVQAPPPVVSMDFADENWIRVQIKLKIATIITVGWEQWNLWPLPSNSNVMALIFLHFRPFLYSMNKVPWGQPDVTWEIFHHMNKASHKEEVNKEKIEEGVPLSSPLTQNFSVMVVLTSVLNIRPRSWVCKIDFCLFQGEVKGWGGKK